MLEWWLPIVWVGSVCACIATGLRPLRNDAGDGFVSFALSLGAAVPGCWLAAELGVRLGLAALTDSRVTEPYEYWTTLWSALWILVGPVFFIAAFMARDCTPSWVKRAQLAHVLTWLSSSLMTLWFLVRL